MLNKASLGMDGAVPSRKGLGLTGDLVSAVDLEAPHSRTHPAPTWEERVGTILGGERPKQNGELPGT